MRPGVENGWEEAPEKIQRGWQQKVHGKRPGKVQGQKSSRAISQHTGNR